MVRGFERLIDDIRNPRASKKRRKAKIDSIPDLPGIRSRKGPFKAPFILKGAKELAKVFVDLGPEGGNPRLFDPPTPPIITRHTQEQLDYEAGLTQERPTVTRREEDEMQIELEELFDQLPTEGEQELAYMTLQDENRQGPQNQTLENALARMGARRPQQFNSTPRSSQFSRLNLVPAPKKKRKVSAYSKRFGIELKKLKKLHPRTKVQNLMKKAHRRTRAAMKKK
jgi:hypothetical protein